MKRRIEIVAFETERITQHSVITACPVCLAPTELLTLTQAAALVQVNADEIFLWLAEGKTHGAMTPGGQRRFCKNSLLRACNYLS